MGEQSPRHEVQKSHHRKSSPKRPNDSDATSPPPKRQRVYVACEHCRLRKQKCDSKRPACSTCIASNQQCIYGAGVKKRGLPPGYVRVLETLFGLIFTKINHSEEAVAALLLNSGVVTRQWALGKADDGNDAVLQRFKKSHICKSIERLLEGEARDSSDPSLPLNSALSDESLDQLDWKEFGTSNSVYVHGHDNASSPTQRVSSNLLTKGSANENLHNAHSSHVWRLPLEIQAPLYALLLSKSPAWLRANAIRCSSLSLRLPGNTWTLLDIYFTWTNCWFPIVQRQEILKTFHSYESGTIELNLESPDAGKHAVLWALVAHASFQDRAATTNKDNDSTEDILTCHQLYETARSLVPDYLQVYDHGHVQALILLSIIKCGSGQKMISRDLIGQAIRIGNQIGLIKDGQLSSQNNGRFELISRDEGIMSGCFVIDTLLSAGSDQAAQFGEQELATIGTIDTDRLEEYEPWFDRTKIQGLSSSDTRRGPQHSFTVSNQLAKIIRILHKYHRTEMRRSTILMAESSSLLDELQIWLNALPSTCQLSLPMSESQKLQVTPQLLNLHIIYQFVVTHCTEVSIASPRSTFPDSSGAKSHTARTNLASLLLNYREIFGCVAMPPIYTQITRTACQRRGLLQPSLSDLQEILANLHKIWREEPDALPALPTLSQHLRNEIEQASKEMPHFLHICNVVPSIIGEATDRNQPAPTLNSRSDVTPKTQTPAERERTLNEFIPQSTTYQRVSVIQQSAVGLDSFTEKATGFSELPLSTHAHITVPEDTLYPISPMSIDTTFKRPEQPASASSRLFNVDFLNSHNPYSQQLPNFEHVPEDFTNANRTQSQDIYDSQYPGTYNTGSGIIDSGSLQVSNYDLDQLFNDLAPLDQGDSQPAFMMNLGISGDPGFDLDAFFA